MKKRKYLVFINIILMASLISLLLSSCVNGANNLKTSKPPDIPPESTFIMDFSDFLEGQSIGSNHPGPLMVVSLNPLSAIGATPSNALGDRSNWNFAALNVGFWNLVGVLGLAIPVAAFIESVKQTPVEQPDNTWIWTFSVTVKGITCTAELHGKYTDSGIRWEMYISKQNEYTDFLWYYGESNLGATEGFWILKEKPSKPDDLIRIDWHRNPSQETGDIRYTNIVPGGAENGGFIFCTYTEEEPYDRSYEIYNKGRDKTTYIEWNSDTLIGRVMDAVHFDDTSWHCWDSTHNNSACP